MGERLQKEIEEFHCPTVKLVLATYSSAGFLGI
jgi:hypothetical protein